MNKERLIDWLAFIADHIISMEVRQIKIAQDVKDLKKFFRIDAIQVISTEDQST